MKKIMTAIAVLMLGLTAQAQTTWVTPITPIVMDNIRIDMINITIPTNMVATGMIGISQMSGSNMINRSSIRLTSTNITALLATCGTTISQLGTVLLTAGGQTNKSIERMIVNINPINNQSMVVLYIAGTNRPVVITDAKINAALSPIGGVAVFRKAFVDFAKANVK